MSYKQYSELVRLLTAWKDLIQCLIAKGLRPSDPAEMERALTRAIGISMRAAERFVGRCFEPQFYVMDAVLRLGWEKRGNASKKKSIDELLPMVVTSLLRNEARRNRLESRTLERVQLRSVRLRIASTTLLLQRIRRELSASEWNALKLYLKGLSISESAGFLGQSDEEVQCCLESAEEKLRGEGW